MNAEMNVETLNNYFDSLVGRFFKILPMKEQNEKTLGTYLENFRDELEGCRGLIDAVGHDARFISLLSILQYLIDNPGCDIDKVKAKVFGAISICNKLKAGAGNGGAG